MGMLQLGYNSWDVTMGMLDSRCYIGDVTLGITVGILESRLQWGYYILDVTVGLL